MSVLKNDRNESSMQFIDTMKIIHFNIISMCMGCPHRWDGFLTNKIADAANDALIHVKIANSIYFITKAEFDERIRELNLALGDLNALVTLVDNLFMYNEQYHTNEKLTPEKLKRIMDQFDLEIRLIKGVIEKDREKFKSMTEKQKEKTKAENKSKQQSKQKKKSPKAIDNEIDGADEFASSYLYEMKNPLPQPPEDFEEDEIDGELHLRALMTDFNSNNK